MFEFSQAFGIYLGTPMRIKSVDVENVIKVDSFLKSVDDVVKVCIL